MGIHFFLLYYLGAINYQTNIVLLILTSCLISHLISGHTVDVHQLQVLGLVLQ